MKTIQVSTATNIQLDWLVAKCEGYFGATMPPGYWEGASGVKHFLAMREPHDPHLEGVGWTCSTGSWSQMGPLVEREGMGVWQYQWDDTGAPNPGWYAEDKDGNHVRTGPTPLIAAARCYVTSKLGETVEVPEELS